MKLKRKILVLALTFAIMLQGMAFTGLAADNDEVTYDAQIMSVKGGADAIATMTFDDGRTATTDRLIPLLEKYGLKASLMLVPTRVQGIEYGSASANVNKVKEYLATGVVDVQSHSYSHLYIRESGEYAANNTDAIIHEEVVGAYNYLNTTFPGCDPITLAVPGSSYTAKAMEKVVETYYATRYSASALEAAIPQSLNPAEGSGANAWHRLSNVWIKESSDPALAGLKSYLDKCVEKGAWFITGCHDIVEVAADTGNRDVTPAALEDLFAKMKGLQDEGKLWVATFSEATKYLREVQNSTVREYSDASGLYVDLTMKDKTSLGQELSADVFNMPLTVKVEIPDGWTKVRYSVNGEETIVDSFTESGKTYAYLDLVPNLGTAYLTDGNKSVEKTELNAEIMRAKGGANAIATMTFDDGLYPTAELLNELCAEYGLKASLMMITNKIGSSYTVADWNRIFDEGYLEPESHSKTHANMTGNTSHSAHLDDTPENIQSEIVDSKTELDNAFPNHDVLTFAIPYSGYTKNAYLKVMQTYYAARGGQCVISGSSAKDGMQSLDPALGTTDGSAPLGSWYNPYIARMQPLTNTATTTDAIIAYLNRCVAQGGWFQGFAHGIAAEGVTQTSSHDMTEAQAREIFSAMRNHVQSGKLWVATFSEATKYLREAQNSTVSAYSTEEGTFLNLTMSAKTGDNLDLDPEIFNMPLTVKLQLPGSWGRVVYSQAGGASVTTKTFKEGMKTFVYIDVVPNGGTVKISNAGDPSKYVESLGIKHNVTLDTSLSYNIYIPTESYVTGVKLGADELTETALDNGYTVYTLEDINIRNINFKYDFSVSFATEAEIDDWMFTQSVVGYLGELVESETATAEDKQIVFDFLNFARATLVKYAKRNETPNAAQIDEVLSKLQGMTPAASDYGTPSELGTVPAVVYGASFAINEKPYYMFYVKTGFTGKLTLTVGEGENAYSTEYDIINGYYHCKDYVVFEVAGVFDLASEVKISAEGVIGENTVTAEGAYSLDNYAAGLSTEGQMNDYVAALYSYVISARNYQKTDSE